MNNYINRVLTIFMHMKNLLSLLVLLVLAASCSTSKFDYNTAYKFSHQQYKKQQEQLQVIEYQPLTSLKPVLETTSVLPSDKALLDLAVKSETKVITVADYKNASKAEKKAIRKQVKQEYKTLRKQIKEAKVDAPDDVVINQKMLIGLIIFGAGILIAILASGAVGAVAIIVGIGLIAWGLIEQT
ncbi:MAG: hypothetical protein DHS20C17_10140 [Cyclobacteriaceae bacterium]|nr:MAG: hypothetical protein DHS20C17_10140 [Cyclobacteriaceae bacterium]